MAAPISAHLLLARELMKKEIIVAAQNVSLYNCGAYTGEIAADQVLDLGLSWVIIGHSERRQYFGETNEIVAQKTKNALSKKLSVVLCIGEKLEEREAGKTLEIIDEQLQAVKKELTQASDWDNVVIAYEPVWAIGTGKVATPTQAQEVHSMIRGWLGKNYSEEVAQKTRIIYGGSVSDSNCEELRKEADIDGFLVGGASLKSAFVKIVQSCSS
jgi:triosephosphate isomerase (TIM)